MKIKTTRDLQVVSCASNVHPGFNPGGKVKSLCPALPADQSHASLSPFPAAGRLPLPTQQNLQNAIDRPLSLSLHLALSLPHPLNHHQKKKKKNLQRKVGERSISALLIHWLPSRTQSSHVKSLDGSYLPCCCWWGTATQMAVICILFWKPNMRSFFLNTPPTQFSRVSLPILTLFLPTLYAKLIRKMLIHSQ